MHATNTFREWLFTRGTAGTNVTILLCELVDTWFSNVSVSSCHFWSYFSSHLDLCLQMSRSFRSSVGLISLGWTSCLDQYPRLSHLVRSPDFNKCANVFLDEHHSNCWILPVCFAVLVWSFSFSSCVFKYLDLVLVSWIWDERLVLGLQRLVHIPAFENLACFTQFSIRVVCVPRTI